MKSYSFNLETKDTEFDELHNIKEISGKKELEQALWMRLMTNKGEWIFDLDFGYPWLELLRESSPLLKFKEALITTLLQEDRVLEVLKAEIKDLDIEKRNLYLYFEVKSTKGLIKSGKEVKI